MYPFVDRQIGEKDFVEFHRPRRPYPFSLAIELASCTVTEDDEFVEGEVNNQLTNRFQFLEYVRNTVG